jgi:dedicated sortase system histidine kinase
MAWAIVGIFKNKVTLMTFKFGLRSKLLFLSSFLFTIPWFGYQYVWEMEKYLRFGQEQTLVGTARALATALHERPNLFNNQASFLPSVEQGKDLYGYQLKQAIQLDGLNTDWPLREERAYLYNQKHQLNNPSNESQPPSTAHLKFTALVGKYDKYLYLFFSVVDNQLTYRAKNTLAITNNDFLEIAYINQSDVYNRFVISNKQSGWLDAYRVTNINNNIPVIAKHIQGNWLETAIGYNIELRIPLSEIGDKISFAIHDYRGKNNNVVIGSANPKDEKNLGTILVPSPEIERIVKGMSYSHARIWVVDQHHRVLASTGDIKKAEGVWQRSLSIDKAQGLWSHIKQQWLHPLYYKILTKPPENFIDDIYDASKLEGEHIQSALQGKAKSQWRLTQDQQAVILSAAYPIYINSQVNGAVIVEETTNGIRTLRNRALEKLFTAILAILGIGTVVFFIFASRISNRIRKLRNQAEIAIDQHGRIRGEVIPSTAKDEIGDLSRSFASVVKRLSQYNHYLENMSARLSHELRTPIAIVRTSLENLTLQTLPDKAQAYLERAQTGINRLNHIITHMSEATRIEQMLQRIEKEKFSLQTVLTGCIQGYQQIYPDITFDLTINNENHQYPLVGSPDHIAQLLDKIVANAVEFSNDKIITITLEERKNSYHLMVTNNGLLLPENMQDKLFESMVSVRPQETQDQPHLGLGLFIARLITEYHQGNISAKNHYEPNGVTINIIFTLEN